MSLMTPALAGGFCTTMPPGTWKYRNAPEGVLRWGEVREDSDGLKNPGGFQEEVAFELILEKGERGGGGGRQQTVRDTGQAHVPGGVGLDFCSRKGAGPGRAGGRSRR